MKSLSRSFSHQLSRIPSSVYLWTAILIFAASNSVTYRIIEIGEQHSVNGRNPISLCNILFVGNLCAFALMMLIFYKEWTLRNLRQLTRGDWISLTIIAILSGALGPGLIFAALDNTTVTNVVLISRLEPPITLALSVFFLSSRVNFWTITGSSISFAGVVTTAFLASSEPMMKGMLQIGKGELFAAIGACALATATVFSKLRLQQISLGIFSIFRTAIGTIVFFVLAYILFGSQHFAEALSPFLWGWMLVYAAVIVVAGQLCWFAGLRASSAATISLADSFNPVAAIFIAYLVLGEVPTVAQYLGGSIILVGIIFSLIGNLRQTKPSVQPSRFNIVKFLSMTVGFKGV